MALVGIWGRPFLDLTTRVPPVPAGLHEEICVALAKLPTTYTGGSHRSMGIQPPGFHDGRPDYGEVIAGLSDPAWLLLVSLGDVPLTLADRGAVTLGEEGDVALTAAQQRWLELRHDVYFPWKVYLELVETERWADKARPGRFTRDARLHLPRTLQYLRSLPMAHIGSVKLLGLMPGDDGTLHRDGDPAEQGDPDEFLMVCPGPPKRLFLRDADGRDTTVTGAVTWFNDHDWHGVHADPWFRCSIRVDGRFDDPFRDTLRGGP